jgi:hypothetical protein
MIRLMPQIRAAADRALLAPEAERSHLAAATFTPSNLSQRGFSRLFLE